MFNSLRLLRLASVVEALSLAVLLGNLFTVHWASVTSVAGPVHGSAYLIVVASTWMASDAPRRAKLHAITPGMVAFSPYG